MKRPRTSSDVSEQEDEVTTSVADAISPFDLLLEDNIIVRIFLFVGNGVQCVKTLSRVCKRFHSLMKTAAIWESEIDIGETSPPSGEDLKDLPLELSKFPVRSLRLNLLPINNVISPSLSVGNFNFAKHLFALNPTLRSLIIHYDDWMSPLPVLVGHLTGLTYLSLLCNVPDEYDQGDQRYTEQEVVDFHEELTKLKKLESLELHGIVIRQSALHSILSCCPLKSFVCYSTDDMLGLPNYQFHALMASISSAKQLTHVCLSGIRYRWTHTLETSSVLSSLPHLVSLIVTNDVDITCFLYWMGTLPLLGTMSVSKLVGSDLQGGVQNWPIPSCLQTLLIRSISVDLIHTASQWLPRLLSLTHMGLEFVDVFEEEFCHGNCFFPSLKSLQLCLSDEPIDRLSNQTLTAIAMIPNLKHLSLKLDYSLDAAGLLRSKFPMKGFALLQNLSNLFLEIRNPPNDPGLYDIHAILMVLRYSLLRCNIDFEP